MNNPEEPPIILFDGVCNLCSASVRFVIQRDSAERFRFGSLQSNAGRRLLEAYGLHDNPLSSVILINQQKAYTKSSAALAIARLLDWPWPLMYGFIIVPKFARDAVYDFIGNRRYRWFGKQDRCWIPPQPVAHRFIDYAPTEYKRTEVNP